MRTWTASTTVGAEPAAVLGVLCDPEACARWAPVDFEVDDPRPLAAGRRVHARGRLAGVPVGFDVDVLAADPAGLTLHADGPVGLEVAYELAPAADGSRVTARVAVHRRGGLRGRVLAEGVDALLRAGALSLALDRIKEDLTCSIC